MVDDANSGGYASRRDGVEGVAYLNAAHWHRLLDGDAGEEAVPSWLSLLCSQIPDVRRGVVVARQSGPFRPTAFWPEELGTSRFLMAIINKSLSKQIDLIEDDPEDASVVGFSRLVRRDGKIICAVGLEARVGNEKRRQEVLRRLQWGSAWLETLDRRRTGKTDAHAIERLTLALDALAVAGEHRGFRAAAAASLTMLAVELKASRVSFGIRRRGHCRLQAVSNTTRFDRRVEDVRAIELAMDEAVDQLVSIIVPKGDETGPYVQKLTDSLAETRSSSEVVVHPFVRDGKAKGAVVFEWPKSTPPEPHEHDATADITALLGPVLDDLLREERWLSTRAFEIAARHLGRLLGPGYVWRKVTLIGLAGLVAFLALYTIDFRVTADARLRGAIERSVVSPIDGYIVDAPLRAGDRVESGDQLLKLDDVEYQLERYAWIARKQQFEKEYAQALAEFDRAGISILRARIEEAEAQIVLNETRIALTEVSAPFDSLIVSGDLRESLGQSVRRGDEMFRLAPLSSFIVEVQVPERDILYMEEGQAGQLVLTSLPISPLDITVVSVTPTTEARDGGNHFLVEAEVQNPETAPLSPGMEGIVKVAAGEASLGWVWTRRLVDWARMTWWRWQP